MPQYQAHLLFPRRTKYPERLYCFSMACKKPHQCAGLTAAAVHVDYDVLTRGNVSLLVSIGLRTQT